MASGSSRRRPKAKQKQKKGLMRMDAALEHLTQLGFSKREITSTINSLIEVYGGDDCWVFIEEYNYKLVIDTILDNQNNKKEHKDEQESQEQEQEQEDEESQEQEESQEEEERTTNEDSQERDAELALVPAPDSPLQIEHVASQQNVAGEEEQGQGLNDDDWSNNGAVNKETDDVSKVLNDAGIIPKSQIGVPPGLKRASCYGYLVETDSETGSDDEDEDDDDHDDHDHHHHHRS